MKAPDELEPAVSYRAADEEVCLRSPDEPLPDVYAEAQFVHDALAAVPLPPHYSTLPRGRRPSHGELGRCFASLS